METETESESEMESESESESEMEMVVNSPTRLVAYMEKQTEADAVREKYYRDMDAGINSEPVRDDPEALDFDPSSDETWSAQICDLPEAINKDTTMAFEEKLFGNEETVIQKKLVYLCLMTPQNTPNTWIAVNANFQCTVSNAGDDMQNPNSGYPSDLQHLTSYGCTSCGSKIYIAGGMCNEGSSNNMFVYNTCTRAWETTLQMNNRRGENPTVVAANDKIFIFGGGPQFDEGWAEVHNPAGAPKSCQILPPFPKDLDSQKIVSSRIISHAVHPNRTKVLLLLDYLFVLAFDYSEMSWNEYEHTTSICKLPAWNKKVVVFEDILFWHSRGTIFAHDLIDGAAIPIYTLPRSGFSRVLFDDKIVPSFLAYIGRGELCLFFQSENYICYFTLLIQSSLLPGTWTPLIVLVDSGILRDSLNHDIMHALELSLQMLRTATQMGLKEEENKKIAKISGDEEKKKGGGPWWTQQFSNDVMTELKSRLSDGSETRRRLLYLQLASVDLLRFSWLEIDFTSSSRVDFRFDKTAEVTDLTDFGCAVWKSKIILVGGRTRDSDSASNKIHIYDTLNKKWENTSVLLQEARGDQPQVVVAGDRVFVFDGLPFCFKNSDDGEPDSNPDRRGARRQQFYIKERYINFFSPFDRARARRFCEYFDFDSSGTPEQPKYLPRVEDQPPLEIPNNNNTKTSFMPFAVYPSKSLILISASPKHIVSFNYHTFKWNNFLHLYRQPNPSKFTSTLFGTLSWHLPVALVEDFLFWVDHSTIYALDLHAFIALPVYTFTYLKAIYPQFESITPGFPFSSLNRSLLPLGKDMLCLIGNSVGYRICFATFKVQLGKGSHDKPPSLQLLLHKVGYLRTCKAILDNSFTISTTSS